MVLAGVPGSKVFWQTEDEYFMTTDGHQCRGCPSHLSAKLALRTIYETCPDAMVFGRSCGAGRSELQTGGRIGQDGSGLLGMEVGLKLRGIADRHMVVISGEGRTLDMGFGDFSSAFDRGQRVTFIVMDNQAYASSGSHKSPTTPYGARTSIFTKGKHTHEKQVPLMMVFGGARYVATATPAYVKDFVTKVQKALTLTPSYVQVLTPCQVSWHYPPEEGVRLSRLAVQTGVFPLWESKDGVLRRTVRIPPSLKVPVMEYLERQGRYDGVTEEEVGEIHAHVEHLNSVIDSLEKALGPK